MYFVNLYLYNKTTNVFTHFIFKKQINLQTSKILKSSQYNQITFVIGWRSREHDGETRNSCKQQRTNQRAFPASPEQKHNFIKVKILKSLYRKWKLLIINFNRKLWATIVKLLQCFLKLYTTKKKVLIFQNEIYHGRLIIEAHSAMAGSSTSPTRARLVNRSELRSPAFIVSP